MAARLRRTSCPATRAAASLTRGVLRAQGQLTSALTCFMRSSAAATRSMKAFMSAVDLASCCSSVATLVLRDASLDVVVASLLS